MLLFYHVLYFGIQVKLDACSSSNLSLIIVAMKITTLQLKIVAIILLFSLAAFTFHVWFKYSHHYAYSTYDYHPSYVYSSSAGQEWRLKTYLGTTRNISNGVIVRSVYFDDRPRNGHDEIGVFLVAVKQSIIDSRSIIGCGVGDEVSSNFIIRSLEENRLMQKWVYVHNGSPHFLYEEYILECYNIPMTSGRKAFVLFMNSSDSPIIQIATSEFPLMFPAPKVQPTGKYGFSVVTCTEAHNKKVAWLQQFVRYQKTTGIDHVHINILDTFIKDGGFQALLEDPQVAKGVAEGYVTMTVWKDILESSMKIYSYSAILRKLDCIYRFRGTYDYAFLLDSDDFFNPMVPGKNHLKDYIHDWCRYSSAGSCYFDWNYYYPDDCGLKNGSADDGNITRFLKSYNYFNNQHYKSVHLISAVIDTGFHHAQCKDCLLPGYHTIHIPPGLAYVAHIRKYAHSPNGC